MKKIFMILFAAALFPVFAQENFKVVECQIGDAQETIFNMYSTFNPEYFGVNLTRGLTFEFPEYGEVRLGGYVGTNKKIIIPGKMLRNDNNVSNVYLVLKKQPGKIKKKFQADLTFEIEGNDTIFTKVLNCKKLY